MKVKTEAPAAYHAERRLDLDLIEKARTHLLDYLKSRRLESEAFTSLNPVRTYLLLHYDERPYEVFSVMFLDTQHRLLAIDDMFRGTLDAASVYPREVAKRALEHNAGAVILAHNHPSGACDPSEADKAITRRLKDALELIGVRVLDHVIVGEGTYSFAEHGLI